MRFFYDTEFLERGPNHPIELISIGMVSDNGLEFFAANADFDFKRLTPWLRDNVAPVLPPRSSPAWMPRAEIARSLWDFVEEVGAGMAPEWWADSAAYDHVLLCQIFGTMSDLPRGWPYFTNDLAQWAAMLGNPILPERPVSLGPEHNALADARWTREQHRRLESVARSTLAFATSR